MSIRNNSLPRLSDDIRLDLATSVRYQTSNVRTIVAKRVRELGTMNNTNSGLQNIVYIKDEPDIRHIARLALEHVGGFSVTVRQSGYEALSVAPTLNPDLILLNVTMRTLDGPNTLASLRAFPSLKHTPALPSRVREIWPRSRSISPGVV